MTRPTHVHVAWTERRVRREAIPVSPDGDLVDALNAALAKAEPMMFPDGGTGDFVVVGAQVRRAADRLNTADAYGVPPTYSLRRDAWAALGYAAYEPCAIEPGDICGATVDHDWKPDAPHTCSHLPGHRGPHWCTCGYDWDAAP